MSIDLDRVEGLFSIIEKAAAHGSKFGAIASAALKELTEINKGAQDEATKQAIADAKDKAARDAKIEALRVEANRAQAAVDENPNIRPAVYPSDSETATIADRRM